MQSLNELDSKTLHEIMQPLNIIKLSCGNIRARMSNPPSEDSDYLIEKMVRIEEQVMRATKMLQDLKRRDENDGAPRDG
jgi:nitrogen fixation/metabolism regulation signal transduction histidine kinase